MIKSFDSREQEIFKGYISDKEKEYKDNKGQPIKIKRSHHRAIVGTPE